MRAESGERRLCREPPKASALIVSWRAILTAAYDASVGGCSCRHPQLTRAQRLQAAPARAVLSPPAPVCRGPLCCQHRVSAGRPADTSADQETLSGQRPDEPLPESPED